MHMSTSAEKKMDIPKNVVIRSRSIDIPSNFVIPNDMDLTSTKLDMYGTKVSS